ncbi:hypothetical protein PUN28_019446 [Cardiocondyla obscurior]|uniref:Uncharacterized protein n=1 Tax=Cardiocondyla obscurior TaxID=286306 RepID=A0AAW2ECT3_9HYME
MPLASRFNSSVTCLQHNALNIPTECYSVMKSAAYLLPVKCFKLFQICIIFYNLYTVWLCWLGAQIDINVQCIQYQRKRHFKLRLKA